MLNFVESTYDMDYLKLAKSRGREQQT